MEFPESGRESAKKFLQFFLSKQTCPTSIDDPLPLKPNWPTVTQDEAEAECMDVSRTVLCMSGCPGLLNYNITKEVTARQLKTIFDTCKVTQSDNSDGNPSDNPGATPIQGDSQLLDGNLLVFNTVQTLHCVCKEWLENLPLLVCSKERPEFFINSAKNTRRKMEDRHSVCVDLNTLYGIKDCNEDQSFYGVYDGHVGVEAASYSSVHVHHNIIRHPLFLTNTVQAIKDGIKVTDERVCAKGIKSGSTAVVSILRGKKLYIGWVGDSQAVLVRRNEAIEIMEPHKPDNEAEQTRIEAAGGMVIFMGAWRVNGTLSVSRAIGDVKEKKFVIGDADVTEVDIDGTEDYLVIACDGVWDVVNGEELVECVKEHFEKGGQKKDMAKAIVDFAISEGSGDNLSVIVVFFKSFVPPQSVTKDISSP